MVLENIEKTAELLNPEKTFGISTESLLLLILGSFIIGLICLVFYNYTSKKQTKWSKLPYLDKFTIAFVVGLASILVSIGAITVFSMIAILVKSPLNDKLIAQLNYVLPIVYFYLFGKFVELRGKELRLEEYVKCSLFIFVILVSAVATIAFTTSLGSMGFFGGIVLSTSLIYLYYIGLIKE